MFWDEKILNNLNTDELRKICNPFKDHDTKKNPNCLIVFVFVPILIKK